MGWIEIPLAART